MALAGRAADLRRDQPANLATDRAFAFAASSSRFFVGAVVSRDWRSRAEAFAMASTAARKDVSFALDGFVKPLIFRTNCKEASRISSDVAGGSKLKSGLMFRHIYRNYRGSD